MQSRSGSLSLETEDFLCLPAQDALWLAEELASGPYGTCFQWLLVLSAQGEVKTTPHPVSVCPYFVFVVKSLLIFFPSSGEVLVLLTIPKPWHQWRGHHQAWTCLCLCGRVEKTNSLECAPQLFPDLNLKKNIKNVIQNKYTLWISSQTEIHSKNQCVLFKTAQGCFVKT